MAVKMNPEVKKLWIEALRNNNYKQCQGRLCKIDQKDRSKAYCCLGVLTDLAIKNGIQMKVEEHSNESSYDEEKYDLLLFNGTAGSLINKVIAWSGVDCNDPVVEYDDRDVTLSELNDLYCLSFHEIADVIESEL